MQIAVSTTAPSLEAPVDPRFTDAPYFVIVDSETLKFQAYENPAAKPFAGHGVIAARFVLYQGAEAVVSDDYCPHSFAGLRQVGVAMYGPGRASTARQAVELLKAGALPDAAPRAGGHHLGHGAPNGQHGAIPLRQL